MSMTDLHSHILPGVDDGAKNAEMSLELLRREYADKVTQIALTPHFNFERESVQEFLQRRSGAARELGVALQKAGLAQQMKLGAEVFYSSRLAETDMRPLCLEGTSLLMIEFPPAYYPQEAPNVLYQLTRQGIVPLIAHVERYAFVRSNPNLLCDLIEAGAYTQMNATSLVVHQQHRNLMVRMIRNGMIHVLATDTHSLKKRPPMLGKAMAIVRKKCGEETVGTMMKNAQVLFKGAKPDEIEPRQMRQVLGRWM